MNTGQSLKFLVVGPGAVGIYIGASLALANHKVVFLAREPTADHLRQHGLVMDLGRQVSRIPHPLVKTTIEQAFSLGPFDLAIFALKSYSTAKFLEKLDTFMQIQTEARLPAFVCLQNGVENEAALASLLGQDKVIAGTVTSSIDRRRPGEITLERLRGVGIASDHPFSDKLVTALNGAGLRARLYSNPLEMKWSKMLTNLLANATSAILGITPADVFSDPDLHRLEVKQLREALTVMDALGLHPEDLPGTPVRALAIAIRWLPQPLSRSLLKRAVGGGRGEKLPSLYIDLHSGRAQTEVGYLNGAVARFGESLGIPTPINHMLTDVLLKLTRRELSLDAFAGNPKELFRYLV